MAFRIRCFNIDDSIADHMINYFKEFMTDESGMELLQEAIIVVIAVSLIAVVMKLRDTVGGKIESTSKYVDETLVVEKGGTGNSSNGGVNVK